MLPVLRIKEHILFLDVLEIFRRLHQETGSTCRRITDCVIRPGIHQLNHHFNDVARRSELPVHTGSGDLGQQILVYITTGIPGLVLFHELIDTIHGGHDFVQHQRCWDFKNRILHIGGIGTVIAVIQSLDEWEYRIGHRVIHLPGFHVSQPAPLQVLLAHNPVVDGHFPVKHAFAVQSQHQSFLLMPQICRIQIMNEHQIGHLFNHIQGISQSSRPENPPQTVYLVFQFSCNHWFRLSLIAA